MILNNQGIGLQPKRTGLGLNVRISAAITIAALACAAMGALALGQLENGSTALAILIAVSIAVPIVSAVYMFDRLAMKPLEEVEKAIHRVALGDLTQVVPTSSSNELIGIGDKFNEMTHKLASTYRSLEDAIQIAKEGQARLESSLLGLQQGFILTNNEDKVVLINSSGMEMLHFKKKRPSLSRPVNFDEVTGTLPASLRLSDKVSRVLKDQKHAKYPDILVGERYFNLYLSPVISDQQSIGCALLFEDITRAKELDRMKTELVMLASHQLRTPAAAVKMNLSLLLDGYLGSLTAEQINGLRQAYNENLFEISLIDGIIAVSELEANEVLIDPVEVGLMSIIDQIVKDKQLEITEHKLKLEVKIPKDLVIEADSSKLRRIFENLIDNAIKYTEPNGRINISAKKVDSNVVVEVTDTGVGIPKEEITKLFQKFSRASNAVKINMAGAGLGLFLAKSLIELHHGQIDVKSELGKGSTFRVTLPVTH